MKNINNYIIEKFEISNNTNAFTSFDDTNEDMLKDIIRATYISIYKNRSYKDGARLGTFNVQRTQVNYKDIAEILNTYYNYNFSTTEFIRTSTNVYKFIKKYSVPACSILINFKSAKISKYNITMDGSKMYWDDWVDYRKKYIDVKN